MNFALIKDDVCINICVFENEEVANSFKWIMIKEGMIDDMIKYNNEFNIGDIYKNGVWEKQEYVQESSLEDYLLDMDYRISTLELGL